MRITRSLAIPALALTLLAGGSVAAAVNNAPPAPASTRTSVPMPVAFSSPDHRCEEDEPCWDCEVMGNLICGLPDIPANEAHRAAAWEAWDDQAGWSQLRVDPSREVRVDIKGYSLSPVTGELSLRGAGGIWYIFSAH